MHPSRYSRPDGKAKNNAWTKGYAGKRVLLQFSFTVIVFGVEKHQRRLAHMQWHRGQTLRLHDAQRLAPLKMKSLNALPIFTAVPRLY